MEHIPFPLRCSIALFAADQILLLRRDARQDWTLPGGTPLENETLLDCARRELREETGMLIEPSGCGLVVESISPEGRLVDLIFVATGRPAGQPRLSETALAPEFVPISQLGQLTLHPPIGAHLVQLHRQHGQPAIPYVRHGPNDTSVRSR